MVSPVGRGKKVDGQQERRQEGAGHLNGLVMLGCNQHEGMK